MLLAGAGIGFFFCAIIFNILWFIPLGIALMIVGAMIEE